VVNILGPQRHSAASRKQKALEKRSSLFQIEVMTNSI
jgi:hypothetical protein